ncbi:dihydrodipicolinate synthase family protein, partial [Paraburkholderia sp. SIMBA_009]
MTQKFGLSAALTTPFKTDGTVDIDAMITHARRCLEKGCDSVTLFGTTGEGCSVGSHERQIILSRFIEAGIAPSRLV